MSYEAGSTECRKLVEAKENVIQVLQSIKDLQNTKDIKTKLKAIYEELEAMHEQRKKIENEL